jgi:hypothetical protein
VIFDIVIGTVSTFTHPQYKFLPTIIAKLREQDKFLGEIMVCEDGESKEIKNCLRGLEVKHFTQEGPFFRLAKSLHRISYQRLCSPNSQTSYQGVC